MSMILYIALLYDWRLFTFLITMKLSVSQVKTFCSSKSKRAGRYILWIKDDWFGEDSMACWKLLEHYLMTGEDKYELIDGMKIEDMEWVIAKYDAAKHNAKWLEFVRGQSNVEVNGMIGDFQFVWYIDNLTDRIDDIKTSYYLTKKDSTNKNHRSWLTTREEYELQLRVYMKVSGIKKSAIIEVATFKYKDESKHEHQILELELIDEFDKRMSDKYFPIFAEMKQLKDRYQSLYPM